MMKSCEECGTQFEPSSARQKFCQRKCNQKAASRRHRAANPGYFSQYRYDITPQQYADMVALQGNRCACCDDVMVKPCVDHDHETGAVRALLCTNCNVGIGMFKEDPARLQKAADYLARQKLAIGHAGNKTPAEKGL